jgi:hypothetical protein
MRICVMLVANAWLLLLMLLMLLSPCRQPPFHVLSHVLATGADACCCRCCCCRLPSSRHQKNLYIYLVHLLLLLLLLSFISTITCRFWPHVCSHPFRPCKCAVLCAPQLAQHGPLQPSALSTNCAPAAAAAAGVVSFYDC